MVSRELQTTHPSCLHPPPPTRRGGHVAPWTAVAPLVALCTDPAPDNRRVALRVLRQMAEKHSKFVSDYLAPAGVAEAWRLHRRLWDAAHPGMPAPFAPRAEAVRGLGEVYAEVVQVRGLPSSHVCVCACMCVCVCVCFCVFVCTQKWCR